MRALELLPFTYRLGCAIALLGVGALVIAVRTLDAHVARRLSRHPQRRSEN